MSTALATIEPTPEDVPRAGKRHPWQCHAPLGHGRRCGHYNRARDAECQDCGAPYAQEERFTPKPGKQLAESVSLSEALEEYARLAYAVRQHFAELAAIEERLGVLFLSQGSGDGDRVESVNLHSTGRDWPIEYGAPARVLESAERQIWGAIVHRSGIFRMLSHKRAVEVGDQLEKGELPPLTHAEVQRWLDNARGSADALLREKIDEVFDWLRPRSKLKSNNKVVVGKRVIVGYVVERANPCWGWKPQVNYHAIHRLTSLETLFSTMAGMGERTKGWKSDLQTAIDGADPEDPRGETVFFKFRACRNGNLHLEFRRPDLLARLNQIAGRGFLPPSD